MRPAWKIGIPGTAALMAAASGTKTPCGEAMFGTASGLEGQRVRARRR